MYNLPLISMALGAGVGYFVGGRKTKWAVVGAAVPLGLQLFQHFMRGNGALQLPNGLPGAMELVTDENGETVSKWRAPLITEQRFARPTAPTGVTPAPAPAPTQAPTGIAQRIAAGEFTVDTGMPVTTPSRPGAWTRAEWNVRRFDLPAWLVHGD